jgi:hypothetical protein
VPLTDADIIMHYQAGTLLQELLNPIDTGQQTALSAQLVALHNAGNIDPVAVAATTEFQNLEKRHFFHDPTSLLGAGSLSGLGQQLTARHQREDDVLGQRRRHRRHPRPRGQPDQVRTDLLEDVLC